MTERSSMRIDLLLVGGSSEAPPFDWGCGATLSTGASPSELRARLEAWLRATSAEALVCWDPRLGPPPREVIERLVAGHGDVWHAGLLLGTLRQPELIDFVAPNWLFNLDVPTDREVTSWRLSIHASVIRTDALRQLGLPCEDFETLCGAVYEWGLRAIQRGAMLRHVPELLPQHARGASLRDEHVPTLTDELRLVSYRYRPFWARWAAMRAMLTGYADPARLARSLVRIPGTRPYVEPQPYRSARCLGTPDLAAARVTVLIPTLHRYKYLRCVLDNLRHQTVRPHEVIIVDQSEQDRRETTIAVEFADLPVRVLYQDEPGQCASRNAGLEVSTGDYVLFIDDDDELPPTLIEQHLRSLSRHDADASSGAAQEVGAPPLSPGECFTRASDVFPTGNTMVRRDVLLRSGLFDLAFNRAPRADGELGVRVYRSGAYMVLDPTNCVIHHRAPDGGLRTHHVRTITYRTSRERLTHRHLPHVSEIYLARRHFSPRQQREMLWLRTFGTFSMRGGPSRRLMKVLLAGAMLPSTIKETRARVRTAEEWLRSFPQIAALPR